MSAAPAERADAPAQADAPVPAERSTVTHIAVAVVERDGHYLIGLRPPGAPLAGYWEFPGGKLQPGETPQAAAIRECREETGLNVEVVGGKLIVDHAYPHGLLRIHFIRCRVASPAAATAPDEPPAVPERFRWVRRAALAGYVFPPANASILELLAREGAADA